MTTPVTLTGSLGSIERSGLQLEELVEFPVPLTDLRVWNAMQTNLPGSAAADDLALIGGTWATASQMVQSSDGSGTTVAQYARFMVKLPECYAAGQRVQIKIHARVQVQADVSATLDVVAYESNDEGGIGSDLVTTAAQSINSTSWADQTFEVTATGLTRGDVLDVRIHVAIDDTGGSNASIADIGRISLMCHIRG